MSLSLEKTLAIFLLFILGMWASQAMSRTLQEEAFAEKHEQWMAEHARTYPDSAEKEKRFKIFKHNLDFIDKFNSEGNRTYKLGINKFADLTNKEFVRYYTGYKQPTTSNPSPYKSFKYEKVTDIPNSLDWRQQGAVTPIKNQQKCGCCWSFSAVAAVEGITQIRTGTLISLSEQQMLDCVTTKRTRGCYGGSMNDAFAYVIKNNGITTEDQYKYMQVKGTCQTETGNPAAQINSYEKVPQNDEKALLKAVSVQPVSVVVAGSNLKRQFYSEGVFGADCGNKLNHAVTVIGYGTTEGVKYWLVKNSWGTSWGENGYAKIERDSGVAGGACGIAMYASYPVVA